MYDFFASDRSNAIPVTPVAEADFPAWLAKNPQHGAWIAAIGFKAEPGTFAFLAGDSALPARVIAVPSPGEPVWSFASLPTALPEGKYFLELENKDPASTDIALGWALGSYSFDKYKTPKRAPAALAWPAGADRDEVERVARGVFLARDLINTPAEDMGPGHLADAAQALAKAHGAKISIIEGDELLRQNYPAIHIVGRASHREPRLIDLRWGDEKAPRVTLVGKGVCFDTGGLDLKAKDGMLQMKKDMGGAAVMLGLAATLMSAGANIRLRLLIPAVENSVAGNAYRPLDIVRTRAGKTVEVGNTDAEGRLVLCDALAEADSEKPDLLLDCATLTGAARIALGPELGALFCENDALAAGLLQAGTAAGDPLWRMPIWKPYRKMIEGACADLNNVSQSTFAGAIIGALFLAEFVSSSTPWAHLDIYASNATARSGRPEGGEATAMRALYAYIRQRYP